MATIIKTSTKEQVYDIIKQKIFLQEYNLGDTINIAALEQRTGRQQHTDPRPPSRLEAEGLVTSETGSKMQVIDLNEKLFREISHSFLFWFSAPIICASFKTG